MYSVEITTDSSQAPKVTERGWSFSLETYGNLAHQLAYSLSWLLYSIGLLVTGIKWQASGS